MTSFHLSISLSPMSILLIIDNENKKVLLIDYFVYLTFYFVLLNSLFLFDMLLILSIFYNIHLIIFMCSIDVGQLLSIFFYLGLYLNVFFLFLLLSMGFYSCFLNFFLIFLLIDHYYLMLSTFSYSIYIHYLFYSHIFLYLPVFSYLGLVLLCSNLNLNVFVIDLFCFAYVLNIVNLFYTFLLFINFSSATHNHNLLLPFSISSYFSIQYILLDNQYPYWKARMGLNFRYYILIIYGMNSLIKVEQFAIRYYYKFHKHVQECISIGIPVHLVQYWQ